MPRTANQSLPMVFVKIKGLKKGSKDLYFECKKKIGDGYQIEPGTESITNIEGAVTKIGSSEYTHEGEVIKFVEMYLNDGVEVMKLTLGLNNLTTSLLNSLRGCEKVGVVKLSIYRNKAGYPSIFVTNDGERTEWAWKHEDLGKMVEVHKVGNQTVVDSSVRDAFLLEELQYIEIVGEVPETSINKTVETAVENVAGHDMPLVGEEPLDSEDDLPF
tara:strand:- start:473 stop:1120 length:648 start_codon:yes stop_codon:yes gene_type:complete